MNASMFVAVLLLAIGLASAAPEGRDTFSCPEVDIDFMGNDGDTVHDIGSWEDCATICTLQFDCKYWTWVHTDNDNNGSRHTCMLKSSMTGVRYLPGFYSGPSGC
eukprot:TRINITY_DN10730_c0_g1_i1.p1 TRINITY_DN10730_c0_g1~~TRINITY_DN10730_c0_g1_i1.p1  ORF type:complete len:105 (+),score=26.04 TRINITY_DN10730_c0_g1_i1:83-397(+)